MGIVTSLDFGLIARRRQQSVLRRLRPFLKNTPPDRIFTATFRWPLPRQLPEATTSGTVPVPLPLAEAGFRLSFFEKCILDYLVLKTYGHNRLTAKFTFYELASYVVARNPTGWRRSHGRTTIINALTKISTAGLVEVNF